MTGIGDVSSNSYHTVGKNLLVSFTCGRIFVFSAVPFIIAMTLSQSSNPTRFFNSKIRGNYRWAEIAGGKMVRDDAVPDPFHRAA